MQNPKITVVIPTRERCDVLRKSLQTVTEQDYDQLEIIVSDNCSSDRTREVVAEARDPRIRYLNTGSRLSMSHNWEFALSQVSGGWVTIIGDDDGLLPESLHRLAEIVGDGGLRAVRSDVCLYSWPSLNSATYGRLRVPMRAGSQTRNCREWLGKVLDGRASYPVLPMLYNGGFVEFSVLESLRSRTGSYYRSCVPDVYAAVAISSVLDTYLYVQEPLAVNGASRHSTGTSYMSKDRVSEASPAQKFAAEGNIPFHPDVPLCSDGSYPPSLQAIVYESYLQTADLRDYPGSSGHAAQLRLIVEGAGAHHGPVLEWGRSFARLHGLDLDAVDRSQRFASFLKRLGQTSDIAIDALNSYVTDWPDFPIRDVYEASVAAATIRRVGPGRLGNLRRMLMRLWARRSSPILAVNSMTGRD